jgi:hypothetical protein
VGFGDSTIDYMVLQKSEIGLKTYGLDSSFGRINDPSPFFTLFKSVPTSNGLLSFSAMRDATFTATAVPLPAPLLLLGSGLLGLAGLRRFRKS